MRNGPAASKIKIPMATFPLLFYILLFVVAFLYASVGHGGASGYLALMALFNFSPAVMKPTALLLNLFVSMVSFIQFYRGKYFKWKLFVPLVILSIPMAFLGGKIAIQDPVYKTVLGLFLIIPICRFLFFKNTDPKDMKPRQSLFVVAYWCSHRFSVGHDRNWRWDHPFPDPAFTEMDKSETNGCYQRFIYFCEFAGRPCRPVYQRDTVQYGNDGIRGRRFCRGIVRCLYGLDKIPASRVEKPAGFCFNDCSLEIIMAVKIHLYGQLKQMAGAPEIITDALIPMD